MTILEYFADKELLVTGVTGLVGKALLEKILRDLPGVRRVHLLIRERVARNGRVVSPEERMQSEVLASSAFDRLREIHGDAFSSMVQGKVEVVPGDLSQQDLGMDPAVRRRLQDSVQVIINCAATVAFDASIREALELNCLGPLRVLDFARGCDTPLVAQVSTCYVHGTQEGTASERPLDPKRDLLQDTGSRRTPYDVDEEVAAILHRVQDVERRSYGPLRRVAFAYAAWRRRDGRVNGGEVDRSEVTEGLRREWVERRLSVEGTRSARRRGWHDVYTYTKAMGEQLIVRNRGDVDTLIFRPSIIESAIDDPAPGWLEGFRMMDPLIVAYGRRQLHDFPANAESIMDLVPVDKVVNALLASIPTAHGHSEPVVYHLATGADNRLTFKHFADLVQEHFKREPLSGRGRTARAMPRFTFRSKRRFMLRLRLRYMLPVRVLMALALLGSVTPWARQQLTTLRARRSALGRLAYWAHIYSPYAEVFCRYQADRMWKLRDSLSEDDLKSFDFDLRGLDWRYYIQDVHIPGIKRFLLGIRTRSRPETQDNGAPASRSPQEPESGTESIIATRTVAGTGRRRSLISDIPSGRLVKRHLGAQWLRRPARTLTRWLWSIGYRHYLGIQIEGMESVPNSGPFIVVSNHNSHLDTGALLVIIGKRERCLHPLAAKDYWFRHRLTSWVSHTFIDAIPFDRRAQFAQSLGLSVALLRENHSILFFPEGGRSTTGKMQPFKPGIGVLALESGAPIVPTRISGSYEALAKGMWFPKRHRIHVRFGAPIAVEPYLQSHGDGDIPELARKITDDVQKAVEALS